ncbi:4-coumarate-CoA ligase 2 [Hyaloscypha variabilis]
MPYKTSQPEIVVPEKETLWSWLFESDHWKSRRNEQRKSFRDGETGEVISYEDMNGLSTCLSTAFVRRFFLRPGDHVTILCENSVWYPVVMFAGLRIETERDAGVIVSAAAPTYVDEMVHAMESTRPKLLVVDSASYKEALKAAKRLGLRETNIICTESVGRLSSIPGLITEVRNSGAKQVARWDFSRAQTSQNTCALICFSSGTTGLPKAAMISNANLIVQSCQVKTNRGNLVRGPLFSPLPLYHITGLLQIMIVPVFLNQDVVIIRKFELRKMLGIVTRHQCEELWLVPPILIRLVNDPVVKKFDLSKVKQFNTGAAPLSPQVIEKLSQQFPAAVIKQHWGMTGSTSCITVTPVNLLHNRNAHTVGTIVSNTTIKIVSPETARGPQIFMGYLGNDEATRQAIDEEGYLHTGDLGSIDATGLVTIHDRIKELIKLEDILLGNPLVKDVAIVGIRDSYSGEVPKAFVVLRPGVPRDTSTAVKLIQYVKSKASRSKWIEGGVEFLDEIPKSASGKILRRVLRDTVKRSDKTLTRASRL